MKVLDLGLLFLIQQLLLLFTIIHKVYGGTPVPALFYNEQLVDHKLLPVQHKSTTTKDSKNNSQRSKQRWKQRYYVYDKYFNGPGSPIFLILGGEGAIEPNIGIMYPYISEHLAKFFGAYVLQPEHRFYGISQPITRQDINDAILNGLPDPRIQLLTYEQALLDAMQLLNKIQNDLNCSKDKFSNTYCPVITVGGSYPGFLSSMARIMFPHIVDMAYAGSAPFRLYAQQVDQSAYYSHITLVAETALPGCANAVRTTLDDVATMFLNNNEIDKTSIGACKGTIPEYCLDNIQTFLDETFMMVGYTFANDNMAYYPPSNTTRLYRACETFMDKTKPSIERLKTFLITSLSGNNSNSNATCFNMNQQLPDGPNATISGGDWSGVGTGVSGDSWDFQTCTLCVEAIGFDGDNTMFQPRLWSIDWLTKHCQKRFHGAIPKPYELNEKWNIDQIANGSNNLNNITNILFTNGMNDGWSISGILKNVSDTIIVINFPNGAHHSDLSGKGPTNDDTDDIKYGYIQIRTILSNWLSKLPSRINI